jgi:ADP-ribose pyrophosphatase
MKIPSSAQRVFKGLIFDVYHWKQKMFDGSEEIFEGLKRPSTIQIIPIFNKKLLLSFEEQPMKPRTYTFFGGRQEKGEDPLVTAKRELLEEAGLESDDWELIKTYEFEGKIEWHTYFYVARNCRKVAEQKLDIGEKIQIKSVDFDKFLKIATSENFWSSQISSDLYRMMHEPEKIKVFKKKLLGL